MLRFILIFILIITGCSESFTTDPPDNLGGQAGDNSGGQTATGGSSSGGETASGGLPATGGETSTGGQVGTGGETASGGTGGNVPDYPDSCTYRDLSANSPGPEESGAYYCYTLTPSRSHYFSCSADVTVGELETNGRNCNCDQPGTFDCQGYFCCFD